MKNTIYAFIVSLILISCGGSDTVASSGSSGSSSGSSGSSDAGSSQSASPTGNISGQVEIVESTN